MLKFHLFRMFDCCVGVAIGTDSRSCPVGSKRLRHTTTTPRNANRSKNENERLDPVMIYRIGCVHNIIL